MIADLARRLVAGDEAALVPLHAAVLAELEARGTVAHVVYEFALDERVGDCRLTRVHHELDFIGRVRAGTWPAPSRRDPIGVRIAAVHLVAVMMACAFDEARAAALNASLAPPSTAA